MPFAADASLVKADLDNTLRGLHRNNSNSAVTGTTVETDLSSFSVPANTIGATGTLWVFAIGTIAGTVGTKTLRLKFGTATLGAAVTRGATFIDTWVFAVQISNTASGAQRIKIFRPTADTAAISIEYTTSAIDTTLAQTLKVTGQLGDAGDTITQTSFEIFVAQVT